MLWHFYCSPINVFALWLSGYGICGTSGEAEETPRLPSYSMVQLVETGHLNSDVRGQVIFCKQCI